MSATEEVLEQIPEAVIEDSAKVITVVKNNPAVLVGVALIAGSAGAALGYKVAQKRLRMYYKDIADQEIAQAKEYYSTFRIKRTPEEMAAELEADETQAGKDAAAALMRYAGDTPVESPAATEEELMSDEERALYEKNGVSEVRVVEDEHGLTTETTTRHSAFEGRRPVTEDHFDFEAEILNRTGERPYVITHDEYYEGEKDYEQTQMVYYQGDDVLVDDRDQPVPDEDAAVGNDNLTRFGHGSKDENIVYVRNENLEVDFEITRSFGKYAEEVLGFDRDDDERGLKHSHGSGGVRRFRTRD